MGLGDCGTARQPRIAKGRERSYGQFGLPRAGLRLRRVEWAGWAERAVVGVLGHMR